MHFALTQNTLKWPNLAILVYFGSRQNAFFDFFNYPPIFSYQSFGKCEGMSNPSLAMFVGLSNTSKWYFGSESQKIHFFTYFGVENTVLAVNGNFNKCCFCCLKRQHMLPKISDLVKYVLKSL